MEKLVESVGWTYLRPGPGSHKIFEHPDFNYHISIPYSRKDMDKGMWNKLLKQAGLK
ncbi:hypothetical protein BK717_20180 [Bacillus thuringiensis serovar malayensis]|nr:hypothetical protein BK717_20180 [Bacillus thuringiensis serovar malayensis]